MLRNSAVAISNSKVAYSDPANTGLPPNAGNLKLEKFKKLVFAAESAAQAGVSRARGLSGGGG